MSPTRTQTSTMPQNAFTPEEIYLREGLKSINGQPVMVYKAHRNTRCDFCEFPLTSDRCHPAVNGEKDLRMACGDFVVRLV